ncbi:hypothetical protein [Parasutterella secunda]|uniref:Uncharacterized protein n=1 Tax=Parasutterella secunda TaxID=626947 RepID=A0ABS2GRW3_9BURK|nr:hypothetical protein [Parasutterella secunda]MBM6928191.1 hypothetical protein [Parasutterella secunda]
MGTAAIAGLIISLIGAAMQTYASYQSNKDAQSIINRAEQQNTADHKKLIDNINQETTNYAAEKRKEAQDEIASQLEGQFKEPVSESQAIRAEQQTTQGDVSEDYKRAKAASDQRTQQTIGTLANLMGRVKSSGRLRMNEGIRMADMASENDWLANNAMNRSTAAKIDAQNALNGYQTLKMLGQGASAVGTALSLGSSLAGSGASAASNAGTLADTSAQLGSTYAPSYAASSAVYGANASPSLWFNFGNAGDVLKASTNDAWTKAFANGSYGALF